MRLDLTCGLARFVVSLSLPEYGSGPPPPWPPKQLRRPLPPDNRVVSFPKEDPMFVFLCWLQGVFGPSTSMMDDGSDTPPPWPPR